MAPREATDAELWETARRGAADAFERLFDRYGRVVYNYCFRRTADWSEAEDLTSAVFLVAWQKRDTVHLDRDGSLGPWLLGIATNLIHNRSRRAARFARALTRLRGQHRQDAESADDLATRIHDERAMAELLARLRRLPRSELEAFALYAWADLSYEEVAAALGVPIGTVRSRIARARGSLASFFEAPSNLGNELKGGTHPNVDH
jgi:RNA polymerase sigma factor (sigma-70 family)